MNGLIYGNSMVIQTNFWMKEISLFVVCILFICYVITCSIILQLYRSEVYANKETPKTFFSRTSNQRDGTYDSKGILESRRENPTRKRFNGTVRCQQKYIA